MKWLGVLHDPLLIWRLQQLSSAQDMNCSTQCEERIKGILTVCHMQFCLSWLYLQKGLKIQEDASVDIGSNSLLELCFETLSPFCCLSSYRRNQSCLIWRTSPWQTPANMAWGPSLCSSTRWGDVRKTDHLFIAVVQLTNRTVSVCTDKLWIGFSFPNAAFQSGLLTWVSLPLFPEFLPHPSSCPESR